MKVNNLIEILLVEDSQDDAELTMRALKKNRVVNNLIHFKDGEEVLEYIFNTPDNGLPKLILLDLKMPKVDGIEVLRAIKKDDQKKMIPVVMLTSSKEERDIIESYKMGVNAYVVKPVELDKFIEAVSQIGLFWSVINEVPKL
ncbi:MAG: response regulator [Cyclobacteriaceae bacterium]|nr:response regulator [Cyclobacteriaceae bacterium]